jgi:hypothetical protein
MQTITRVVYVVLLLACVMMSAAQVMAKKPGGGSCQVQNGTCVSVGCTGECGPIFPATCACIH